MTMKLKQDSEYKGKDSWKWSVWVEGDNTELDSVESVEYTLHPTFPNPVQVKNDRASKFKLTTSGWGTFTIYAKIRKNDGDVVDLEHQLVLNYPDELEAVLKDGPRRSVSSRRGSRSGKVSSRSGASDSLIDKRIEESLKHPKYAWRTLGRVAIVAGVSEEEAADKLRANESVRFGRNKKGQTIVGLKNRVGDTPSSTS